MLIAKRSGIHRPLNAANAIRDVIGIAAGFCFWALVVWGFSGLRWYVAALIVLAAGFCSGLIVNRWSFALFFRVEPLVDLLTLSMTGWLWVAHWPY